jgi:CRP-like cAMP-binding protein
LFLAGDRGDALHFVASGRIAIRGTTPAGDVATLDILGVGRLFGELSLVTPDHHRSAGAVALEPSSTMALTRAQFEALRRSHPEVVDAIFDVMAATVRRLTDRLMEALYLPAPERVARRLLELCVEYGTTSSETVSIPLTQSELAGLAGSSRQVVSTVLNHRLDGAVTTSRHRIVVLDRSRVEQVAKGTGG